MLSLLLEPRPFRNCPVICQRCRQASNFAWEYDGEQHSCLVDTGSMVSTVMESLFSEHFSPWGHDRMIAALCSQRSCNGYLELHVALCSKVIPYCGILVVKDPSSDASSVPGILRMNVIRCCCQEAPGPVLEALQKCQQSVIHRGKTQ